MKTSYSASEFLTGLRARVVAGKSVLELDGGAIAPDAEITLRAASIAALMTCPACSGAHPVARPGTLKTVVRNDAGLITSLLEEPVNIVDSVP